MFPRLYFYPDGDPIMSVNGSSEDGNCNLTSSERVRCREPTTSVLQDGNIPTLTGLDGDMWASQLLTINPTKSSIDITFDFRNITPSYDELESVEVVMFNCPEWGISVDNITLLGSNNSSRIIENRLVDISLTNTSCASLVKVFISGSVTSSQTIISSTLPVLTLRFQLSPASTWVHLAEVTFYGAGPTYPPVSVLIQIPPPITPDAILPTSEAMDTSETESLLTSSLIVVSSVLFFIVLILATIIIILSLLLKYQHTSNTDTLANHGRNVKPKYDGTDSTIEGERQIYEQLQISGDDRVWLQEERVTTSTWRLKQKEGTLLYSEKMKLMPLGSKSTEILI